jgi:DNA adenine methylase
MSVYTCEKCGKMFSQKSQYTSHRKRKMPCITTSITTSIITLTKPIIKWVGGKTQIIDKIMNEFPLEMNNYHEPFLGGGSVLLGLLTYIKMGKIVVHNKIYAYDLNEPLIHLYKNIQTNHDELYDEIQKIINEWNECGDFEINRNPATLEEAKLNKENYYYWIRRLYNKLEDKNTCIGSALFVFLNKTCFRGVFRMGPNGFNVPYGHYKNPEIINREHLNEVHELIQGVLFECCDFTESMSRTVENDFVYLDPPYAPETQTSFVDYTESGFNLDKHQELFKLVHSLTHENKKIMMSNADVTLVRDTFNTHYKIETIVCRRAINSKNPESKTNEVIIKNYT